jgi:sulfide dehydrogenase cytochrome subunit
MRRQFSSSFALVITFAIHGLVATQYTVADELIESCNHCHDGVKQDIPVINGTSTFALETSLLAYVEDSRVARPYEGEDMKSIMKKLTDVEFKKIIDHYSSQTFIPVRQSFNTELASKGKTLHESYCSRCHTEGGSLADDDSGILAGQWKNYLIEEMKNYKNSTRLGDKKMTDAIKPLTDNHIQALAEYYASQQ